MSKGIPDFFRELILQLPHLSVVTDEIWDNLKAQTADEIRMWYTAHRRQTGVNVLTSNESIYYYTVLYKSLHVGMITYCELAAAIERWRIEIRGLKALRILADKKAAEKASWIKQTYGKAPPRTKT